VTERRVVMRSLGVSIRECECLSQRYVGMPVVATG
jgi:hypothetical protein